MNAYSLVRPLKRKIITAQTAFHHCTPMKMAHKLKQRQKSNTNFNLP